MNPAANALSCICNMRCCASAGFAAQQTWSVGKRRTLSDQLIDVLALNLLQQQVDFVVLRLNADCENGGSDYALSHCRESER